MKNIAILLAGLALSTLTLAAPKVSSVNAFEFVSGLKAPLFERDFEAERTISGRGMLVWWKYHASSRLHMTEYFGTVEAMELTVADTQITRQYWLNLATGELVATTWPSSTGDTELRRFTPEAPGYHDTLMTMRDGMATMITLNSRNTELSAAVDYLTQIADAHPTSP